MLTKTTQIKYLVKKKLSYIIGLIIGLMVRFIVSIYNRSFWYFRNDQLFKGLNKTSVYPGLIKAPILLKKEKIENLSKLNTRNNIDMNSRRVVYTCVTGKYDQVNPVYFRPKECDFLLFTDNPSLQVEGWLTIPITNPLELDQIRMARMVKVLPHRFLRDYEISIWLDGNYDIIGDIADLFEYCGGESMALFAHFEGHATLRVEAEKIIESGKADKDLVYKQIETYYKEGFKEETIVLETGIIIRKHNEPIVIEAMEQWWHEIKTHTQRDQLSLPYVLWKTGLDFHIISGNNRKSELYVRRGHSK